MVTRTRFAAVLASLMLVLSCLSIGLAPPASADVSDVGGGAEGVEASVTFPLGSPLTLGPEPSVTLPAGGGDVSDDAFALSIPGALSTGTVTVSSKGSNGATGGVVSDATVEGLSLLPAVLLSAQAASATCTAGYQPTSPTAQTRILGLSGGTLLGSLLGSVPEYPEPNTVINVPGVGSITFNKQTPITNGIEVTAISIDLNVALVANVDAEISTARCAAVGQGSEEPPVDDPTVIEVDTTEDVVDPLDGATSLREAVTAASLALGGATIVLQDGATYDLTICNLLNVVNEDLNLTGDLDYLGLTIDPLGLGGPLVIEGNGSTINQTCPNDRVFEMFGLGDVTLRDTNITGGNHPGNGGGVSRNLAGLETGLNGTLTFDGGTVQGNQAGGNGGGLYSDGALTCIDSTLTENIAGQSGGALFGASGIDVTRCTVDRNRGGSGGGIGAASLLGSSDVSVVDSTIHANRAQSEGGANVDTDGNLTSSGSVIALSSEPGPGLGDDCVVGGTATSGGGSLGGNDCGFGTGDVLGDHPQLSPLTDNGGPTATMAPVAGSGVIDTHDCDTADQRGESRPQGAACDSGAIDEPAPACTQAFPDVSVNHPFFEEICWMQQMGITTGYVDGSFRPGDQITRQSMAAFTFRISGSPLIPVANTTTFPDAPPGFVFHQDVEWMADESITRGYSDGTFRPAAPVTRQAMSAFIYRLAGEPSFIEPTSPVFPDVDLQHPFFLEIAWLQQSGIAQGYADGTFKPDISISRQAMAAFLARLAQEPEVWG